jgi:hypothetical protein
MDSIIEIEMLAEFLVQGLEDYNQSVRTSGSDHMGTEEFMQTSSHSSLKASLGMLSPLQVHSEVSDIDLSIITGLYFMTIRNLL